MPATKDFPKMDCTVEQFLHDVWAGLSTMLDIRPAMIPSCVRQRVEQIIRSQWPNIRTSSLKVFISGDTLAIDNPFKGVLDPAKRRGVREVMRASDALATLMAVWYQAKTGTLKAKPGRPPTRKQEGPKPPLRTPAPPLGKMVGLDDYDDE